MKTILAAFAILIAFPICGQTNPAPNQALIEANTAGFLSDACEHPSSDVKDGFCAGQISGFRTVIDVLPVLVPNRDKQIKIEPTATNGQLERVFVAYVKAHPAIENKTSFLVFCWALKDADLMVEVPIVNSPAVGQ